MKTPPFPYHVAAALSDVGRIADDLAATACDQSVNADVAAMLDNLDDVAAAVTLTDLADAPAKLNAVARAFRQTFPCDSLGWDDAGLLQTYASRLAAFLADQTAA